MQKYEFSFYSVGFSKKKFQLNFYASKKNIFYYFDNNIPITIFRPLTVSNKNLNCVIRY
jgi:hypothetical protein